MVQPIFDYTSGKYDISELINLVNTYGRSVIKEIVVGKSVQYDGYNLTIHLHPNIGISGFPKINGFLSENLISEPFIVWGYKAALTILKQIREYISLTLYDFRYEHWIKTQFGSRRSLIDLQQETATSDFINWREVLIGEFYKKYQQFYINNITHILKMSPHEIGVYFYKSYSLNMPKKHSHHTVDCDCRICTLYFISSFCYGNMSSLKQLRPEILRLIIDKIDAYLVSFDTGFINIKSTSKPTPKPEDVGDVVTSSLTKALPNLNASVNCPKCKLSFTVYNAIIHLNDTHKWTREEVADWTETLDINLEFNKVEESPETDSKIFSSKTVNEIVANYVKKYIKEVFE